MFQTTGWHSAGARDRVLGWELTAISDCGLGHSQWLGPWVHHCWLGWDVRACPQEFWVLLELHSSMAHLGSWPPSFVPWQFQPGKERLSANLRELE